MTEKSKRKVNPRRRTLIRLLLGITIFAALISAGIYVLQPKSAQIVFIAPDDNGIDAIWIADLNDPENPRQLIHLYPGSSIFNLQVAEQGPFIIYSIAYGEGMRIWIHNTKTGTQKLLCEPTMSCGRYDLHPNGEWLSFYQSYNNDDGDMLWFVTVLDLQNDTIMTTHPYEISTYIENGYSYYDDPSPRWIGDSSILVYRVDGEDMFEFYDVVNENVIDRHNLNTFLGTPTFSDDGSHYFVGQFRGWNLPERPIYEVREADNPDSRLLQLIAVSQLTVYDWHPDNETILVVDNLGSDTAFEMYLYNTGTQIKETLLSNTGHIYYDAQFNHDANQILYNYCEFNEYIDSRPVCIFMLYDMETREEIALPLFGRNPQWVNGGR